MSDSDENIPYGRKFGSGFRGTRYDGTVADDVENTPIIPDDMYRQIVLIHLDILVARGVRIQAQSVDGQDDELSFDVYCYNVQPGYAIDYLTGAASKG